jgi:hypothetical protein
VRRFHAKVEASGQGVINSRPAGPRGQAGPGERPRPSGERESGPVGERKGSGPRLGQKPELGPIQEIKHFQILFGIQIFSKFGNLYTNV